MAVASGSSSGCSGWSGSSGSSGSSVTEIHIQYPFRCVAIKFIMIEDLVARQQWPQWLRRQQPIYFPISRNWNWNGGAGIYRFKLSPVRIRFLWILSVMLEHVKILVSFLTSKTSSSQLGALLNSFIGWHTANYSYLHISTPVYCSLQLTTANCNKLHSLQLSTNNYSY